MLGAGDLLCVGMVWALLEPPCIHSHPTTSTPTTHHCHPRSGAALGTEAVLRVAEQEQEFVFEEVEGRPVPSLLRGFSGGWVGGWRVPVCWLQSEDLLHMLHLLAHPDPPSRPPCRAAPVHLTVEGQSEEDLLHLLAHDTDSFNRWEAGHVLAKGLMRALYSSAKASNEVGAGVFQPLLQPLGGWACAGQGPDAGAVCLH